MRAEGFSWCLDGLYGGIGISKLQIYINFCSDVIFSQFLIIEILDPEPDPH
jgi:hypothetical protein